MTKTEWVAEAMRLADEMASLSETESDIYNEGFPANGRSVEQQAASARAAYDAARLALTDHLKTAPGGGDWWLRKPRFV